jgi:cytosine/adenosine deaminase-related metal-dependent hydrolase
MKSFKADYVFPVHADPIKNGIVTVTDSGKVISISETLDPEYQNLPIETLSGIITPGFINTHCHTELSHLKDKIKPSGGLINFIKDIQAFRNADAGEVLEAAQKADQEMYDNGIVAVADTANSNITVGFKRKKRALLSHIC